MARELREAAFSCIHELFAQQVARTPDHIAVVFGDEPVTYCRLNERANRLAHHLRASGVGPETLVGVYLERGIELVVAMLGILKAGGAYLPIDPECPQERLAFMVQDASVRILLTEERLRQNIPVPGLEQVCVDTDGPRFACWPGTDPPRAAKPSNLAYVIYTSGSTGTPKGVLVEHRSVVHLFRATADLFQFGAGDVWTLFHSAAFDFSVWEMWGALLHGGRLVVVPRSLTRSPEGFYELLERERVTVLNQTPSAFDQLMLADQALGNRRTLALRYVIFGGEALHLSSLRPWFAQHGGESPQLINMYGITETTVHVTFRRLNSSDAERGRGSLVGQPLPGYRGSILDDDREPVTVGQVGEIHVGGLGVARGYLGRPGLTALRFLPDPSGGDIGARLYRSGDLGRLLPNDEIEYIGRNDRQVKLRGFRIELGEIESALNTHAAVARCVTVVRRDEPAIERLVTYWVRRGAVAVSQGDLRAHVAATLPEYMVPASFVELARLPLTINGKLDRKALPAPGEVRSALEFDHLPPRNALEEQLASVWSDVLGIECVGVDDNFFELGGHSLLAIRAAVRIRSLMDVALPLTVLFEQPTIAGLARRIAEVRAVPDGKSAAPIPRLDRRAGAERPLSSAQQGLWLLHQIDPDLTAYHISEGWRLDGPLDVASLRSALQAIIERHAPLRTNFRMSNGRPVQVVGEAARFELSVHDLQEARTPTQDEEVARRTREHTEPPFDLTKDILLRATLLRLCNDQHILLVTLHHIAADGWSLAILRRELESLYREFRRGRQPAVVEPPVQYADYAVWQQDWLHAHPGGELLTYWRRQLEGLSTLELQTDWPRHARFSYRGAKYAFSLPADLTARVRALGQASDVTLHMTLLAGYLGLLSRLTGQIDLAVGTPVAGRNHLDLEDLIGLFVNMLVLRVDLGSDPTFRELLGRVRAVSLGAYDHQDLPFETLVDELRPEREQSRNPLVQVVFQVMQFDDRPPSLEGLELKPLAPLGQAVRFDLELHLWEEGSGLRGTIAYCTDLFDRSTIERIAGHYGTLLEAAVANPDVRLSELPVLKPAQREELLGEWSGAGDSSAPQQCIHELFEAQAERSPDAVALVHEGQQLTYGQLDLRANQLAHHLQSLGVEPETPVAIYLGRTPELVVAMLGILKAGGAYLPLDLEYPRRRLDFMMKDAGAELVITEKRLRQHLPETSAQMVCLDSDGMDLASQSRVKPAAVFDSTKLAYIMYTSGSTGRPNGVCIPHRAVTRLVVDTNYVQLHPSDRIAQAANASFDAATFEVWGGLLNGAQVVFFAKELILSPSHLHRELREHGITVMFVTTALFNQLAALAPGVFASVRCLLFGGEAADPARVHAVLKHDPPGRLLHVYGPTENTTFSTFFDVTRSAGNPQTIPIGRPITNTTCYVLDDGRRPVPVGVAGELYLGGTGLARGYWNRPALTAERFVDSPFQPGEQLYRTGDRVRWNKDGNLEFLGRLDHQVKLRGYRIELGEIASALREHEGVEQCEVVLWEDGLNVERLVAYWVSRRRGSATVAALRIHLHERLPDYMMPAAFVRLPSLPLTANGKLDRAALPPPRFVPSESEGDDTATRRPLEQALAAAWARVLGVDRVSVHDNFFQVGGNSLLALHLISEIEKACGRHIPLSRFFSHPSIASLVDILETKETAPATCSIMELRRGGLRPPLYFPPGIHGELFNCAAILEQLPPDQPIRAIECSPRADSRARTMEEMALAYCEMLTNYQPEGPLLLAGYSFAGLLAYEMARNLSAQGRDVRLVAIIDTGPGGIPPRSPGEALESLWLFLRNLPRWTSGTLVRVPAGNMLTMTRRTIRKFFKELLMSHRELHEIDSYLVADDIFDTGAWPDDLRARVDDNLRALSEFRYRHYAGRVVLFRARERPLFHSHANDLGWGRFVLGELEVVDLNCNHATILKEPHVWELGRRFRLALDAAANVANAWPTHVAPADAGATWT
jgi:amino acid adenylation domain-containing protein